jgi:hypothetical protein
MAERVHGDATTRAASFHRIDELWNASNFPENMGEEQRQWYRDMRSSISSTMGNAVTRKVRDSNLHKCKRLQTSPRVKLRRPSLYELTQLRWSPFNPYIAQRGDLGRNGLLTGYFQIAFRDLYWSLRGTIIEEIRVEALETYVLGSAAVKALLGLSDFELQTYIDECCTPWQDPEDFPNHIRSLSRCGKVVDPDQPPTQAVLQAIFYLRQNHLPGSLLGDWQFMGTRDNVKHNPFTSAPIVVADISVKDSGINVRTVPTTGSSRSSARSLSPDLGIISLEKYINNGTLRGGVAGAPVLAKDKRKERNRFTDWAQNGVAGKGIREREEAMKAVSIALQQEKRSIQVLATGPFRNEDDGDARNLSTLAQTAYPERERKSHSTDHSGPQYAHSGTHAPDLSRSQTPMATTRNASHEDKATRPGSDSLDEQEQLSCSQTPRGQTGVEGTEQPPRSPRHQLPQARQPIVGTSMTQSSAWGSKQSFMAAVQVYGNRVASSPDCQESSQPLLSNYASFYTNSGDRNSTSAYRYIPQEQSRIYYKPPSLAQDHPTAQPGPLGQTPLQKVDQHVVRSAGIATASPLTHESDVVHPTRAGGTQSLHYPQSTTSFQNGQAYPLPPPVHAERLPRQEQPSLATAATATIPSLSGATASQTSQANSGYGEAFLNSHFSGSTTPYFVRRDPGPCNASSTALPHQSGSIYPSLSSPLKHGGFSQQQKNGIQGVLDPLLFEKGQIQRADSQANAGASPPLGEVSTTVPGQGRVSVSSVSELQSLLKSKGLRRGAEQIDEGDDIVGQTRGKRARS